MSNLLSQASLVMIPSGYKEDVVYSQIPTNGNGDLSFTRASNGTRVNSAGLVEVVPWNLVENSENFSAVWTAQNSTITTNSIVAPNGTTTADSLIASNGVNFYSGVYVPESTSVVKTISCYVKKGSKRWVFLLGYSGNSNCWFDLDNGVVGTRGANYSASSITSVGNGWYRIDAVMNSATGANTNIGLYGADADNSNTCTGDGTTVTAYIWGYQANIGSTAKPYFPTTDRLNVPRLTYQNGGGGCPSLLLEKQSTNLVTYSEQFDNADWLRNVSVTANATTSPDGTQNADKILENASSTQQWAYQSFAMSGAQTATIYAKKGERNYIALATAGLDFSYFNLDTGVVVSTALGATASITSVGNGWYRCSVNASTPTSTYFIVAISDNGTRFQYAGDTSKGIYVWGAQNEASSYPTSYIPTTSSSATRVADVATVNLPNTNMTFTAYLECEEAPLGTAAGDWLAIYSNVSILGRAYGYANTFGFADAYNLGVASGTKMVWKQESGSTAKLFKGGALVGTTTTGTYTDPFNRFRIDGAYLDKPLKIKEFVFFDNALTDAECIQLTA